MADKLRPDELAAFKAAFDMFDKNQDGTISTKVRRYLYHHALQHLHKLCYKQSDATSQTTQLAQFGWNFGLRTRIYYSNYSPILEAIQLH